MQRFAVQKELTDWGPVEQRGGGSRWQEMIAASGISVRVWRLYASFWLVCLVFPILSLVQAPPELAALLIAVAGLIFFIAMYFWVIWPHPLNAPARRFRVRAALLLIIGLTILVIVLTLGYDSAFLWLFLGVSAIAGLTLPFRNASIVVFALTLLTLGISIGNSRGMAIPDWLAILPLVLLVRGLGLDMIGFVRLSDALRELQSTREELARQAVTEERLRMARDLHDLLGHTLSLITLKSELAGRLVEIDPQSALKEIHEVEQVARQALREVREAVSGYRQQTLHSELEDAHQILEAAGINCTIDEAAGRLPPGVDTVLTWVVREGVTNVIRHSRARACWIRIATLRDAAMVEVSNDGYIPKARLLEPTGSGLSGLSERVKAIGGDIEAGPQQIGDHSGFRLSVKIPIILEDVHGEVP